MRPQVHRAKVAGGLLGSGLGGNLASGVLGENRMGGPISPPRGLCLFGDRHPAGPSWPLRAFKAVGQVLGRWPTEDAEWKQMCGRVWLWAQRSSTSGVLGLGVGDAQMVRGTQSGWDSDMLPPSDHSVLVRLASGRNSFIFLCVH